jgi:hypothetical protein
MRAAAAGSRADRRWYSAGRPRSAASSSSLRRTAGSVGGKVNSSTTAWKYRPDPPTSSGIRSRASTSSMAARAIGWKRATENSSAGSTTSTR